MPALLAPQIEVRSNIECKYLVRHIQLSIWLDNNIVNHREAITYFQAEAAGEDLLIGVEVDEPFEIRRGHCLG
jgi:hypothetical protein